jgi:hypothetical protein
VAGDWRRLHNWELHKLYASPNIVMVEEDDVGVARSTHGRETTRET